MATLIKYTDEQTAALRNAYEASPTEATIQAMATSLGKTVRSVVAKLAQLGIYQSKEKVVTNQRAKKADLVAKIAAIADLDVKGLESLEKADRVTLLNLHNFMERQTIAIKQMQDELDGVNELSDGFTE